MTTLTKKEMMKLEEEQLNDLVEHIMKQMKIKQLDHCGYILPIESIDNMGNITVEFKLRVRSDGDNYHFRIKWNDNELFDEWLSDKDKEKGEKPEDFVKKWVKRISDLKFKKEISQFVIPDKTIGLGSIMDRFYEYFDNKESVKLSVKQCCVCFELTNAFTKDCKHSLCYPCVSHLIHNKEDEDEGDDNECQVDCPMCRQSISIYNPLDTYWIYGFVKH